MQCKHSSKGGIQDDTAILGLVYQAKTAWNVDKLVAVTNTEFSCKAKQTTTEYGFELIEISKLVQLIKDHEDRIPILQEAGL